MREKNPRLVSPFLAWVDFHARSRFACSTIPEEKWGTTRSLVIDLKGPVNEGFDQSSFVARRCKA